MHVVNAQDYGFLPSNSGTINRDAWDVAITAAAIQGQPLYLPAGTYALELSAEQSRGVVLAQAVTIVGDGPDQTVIDVYPKRVSFPYYVIWWNSPDLHVTVRGLKVVGPSGPTEKYDPDHTPDSGFLYGNIAEPYDGSDNRISVDNLVVTGKFIHVISTWNGDGLVEVRNSDLTALDVCIAVLDTKQSMNKRFHADNCRFASGIPETETSDGQPHGICVYLHPYIATRVTNCRFYDNPRDAIKQYGEDDSVVGRAPKYSQYIGCHFFNCVRQTILTPGEDVVTLIEGCSFDQGHIACRNKTTIIGCEFRHGAGIGASAGRHEDLFEVQVVGCWVHCSAPGHAPKPPEDALRDHTFMSLLVRDCLFSFADGCDDTTRGVSLGNAVYGEVSSCRFVRRPADNHASAGAKVSPQIESSRYLVEHCSFDGRFQRAGLDLQPGPESGSIEVNHCDFSQVDGTPIHFNGSDAHGRVIRGGSNLFNDQPITTGGVNGEMNMRARLRLRQAIFVGAVSALPFSPGDHVPPPDQKYRIVLDRSYNTFHVTGGVPIDDVQIGVPGHSRTNRFETNKFEGPVHLIADDAWSLTANGNVRPRGSIPRQMQIHEVVTLMYDPSIGLWYEA